MKVFLDGTYSIFKSGWRAELIPLLEIKYFNPIDWNERYTQSIEREKQNCDILLFFITKETNCYEIIAKAVDCSNKSPNKTLFVVNDGDFNDKISIMKSFKSVGDIIINNGGKAFCMSILELAEYLNNYKKD
jgi:hypothetical protein